MKKSYLLLKVFILFTFLMGCSEDDEETIGEPQPVAFKNFGLANRIVYELKTKDGFLYAATDNGLFSRNLTGAADWQPVGLQGEIVKTMVFLPNNVILAAGSNQSKTTYKIYKKVGGSAAFQEVANNFGGGFPESLNNFFYLENSQEILAVGNTVIAKSTDLGSTWTPLQGEWQGLGSGLDFVQANPLNGDLWSGGQNGIESFTLFKYSQAHKSWSSWQGLLPAPSVAKDIAFDKTNANTLLIGGEDGIIKTTDNGATWTTIKHDDHKARFYFGVEIDETDNKTIYAASWLKNFDHPQPLILYISRDGGANWEEFAHKDATLFGGVWDMVQVKSGNQTRLYMGLYKGGVYEVTVN
ncbi:WD40/YVTN/BNR-like repeat-containing protein [Sabulibacter ruber]|uniref:WD40/YVTN/BNR-like repeat-containing protein n=1 Tax=Sabulibacter ruber TaxID=2811901 RepID=UPI001A96801E|nr:YCF48-related protein [Sabulibacter ruber]